MILFHDHEYQLWEIVDWNILYQDNLSGEVVDAILEGAQRNLDIKILKNPSDVMCRYY